MEAVQIGDQLHRSAHGPAWHGPSVEEVLQGVTATQACTHVALVPHSIAELVLHIAAWARVAAGALDGIAIPEELADDWTSLLPISEAEWAAMKQDSLSVLDLLATKARSADAKLADTVPGREYSFYVLLHGVAQHTIYHAGQIAILKRLLSAQG